MNPEAPQGFPNPSGAFLRLEIPVRKILAVRRVKR
jgi:hypothetical protein